MVCLEAWLVQGKVTHFVSWCWAYSLKNVVSAVGRWLQNSGEDPRDVFLWMCFFCNNQYRIQDEPEQHSCRLFCNPPVGSDFGMSLSLCPIWYALLAL